MNITQIRKAVEAHFDDLPEEKHVTMGMSDYGQGPEFSEVKIMLHMSTGEPSPEAESRVDELFNIVPRRISDDPTLGGIVDDAIVTRCGGHKIYRTGEGQEKLGTDFTIVVRGD